jgi:hypothetical protein
MLRNAIAQWAWVGEPFSSLIGCSVANLFSSPENEADDHNYDKGVVEEVEAEGEVEEVEAEGEVEEVEA